MKLFTLATAMLLINLFACNRDPLTTLPEFSFLLSDSITVVNSKDIPTDKPIVLFYFRSTCKGCQEATDSLLHNIESVKHARFYFLSREPMSEVRLYESHFKMRDYPDVTVGQDYETFIAKFFRNPHTPIIALYGSNKQLQGVFDGEPHHKKLLSAIQAIH